MVLRKPPMQWDETDLQSLIDAKVEESSHIEYKRQLNITKARDRKEIAKDVSAFANGMGGIIVYGIEERETTEGPPIPVSLCPIQEPGLEKRLEDILLNSTSPRMEFRINPIVVDGGYYVVVEIPQSFAGPHMVTLGDESRYYKRRNFQAYPMTEEEIRVAYLHSAQSLDTVRERYVNARLTPTTNGIFYVQTVAVPLYMHDLLINPPRFDTSIFNKPIEGAFNPTKIYRGRPSPGPNGFEFFSPNREKYDYALRLLESGHLENIETYGFGDADERERFLPSQSILEALHDTLLYFGQIYQAVGYFGPFQLYYRLLGLRGSSLGVGRVYHFQPGPIQEDEWERGLSTDVWATIQSPLGIVRHFMDLLWNAYGYKRCFLFDEQGELK